MTLARVVGADCRGAGNLLVGRDLVEQFGQHGGYAQFYGVRGRGHRRSRSRPSPAEQPPLGPGVRLRKAGPDAEAD